MDSISLITDIHTHVLPNIDDGPSTMEQTRCLLNRFSKSGVDRIFCTPHYRSPHFHVRSEVLEQAFSRVVDVRSTEENYPELRLGAEVRICHDLITDIKFNCIPTLSNTGYILIEFPSSNISSQSLEIVYELKVRGFRPIMAHPERNIAVQHKPNLLDNLIESGILLQLTADCFTRKPKPSHPQDKLAWNILKRGYATVIASDSHDMTWRPPLLVEAYDNIASQFGQQIVDSLVENANAIWDGENCSPVAPATYKKRWLIHKTT